MALARNMQTGNATFLSNSISDVLYISFLRDTVTPIICVTATYSVKLQGALFFSFYKSLLVAAYFVRTGRKLNKK